MRPIGGLDQMWGILFLILLMERLSGEHLARLEEFLPGPKSRQALVVTADESAFLKVARIRDPNQTGTRPRGGDCLAGSNDNVMGTIHKLPDFYATRTTIAYMGTPTAIPPAAYEEIFGRLGFSMISASLPV